MKTTRSILLSLCAIIALPLTAQPEKNPERARFLSEFLTWCDEAPTVEERDFDLAVDEGTRALLLNVASDDPFCSGVYLEVSRDNRVYVGQPWLVKELEGSLEKKIEQYAWQRMKKTAKATVSERRSPERMFQTEVSLTTEYGPVLLRGVTDPKAQIFYPGGFISQDDSYRSNRLALVKDLIPSAPSLGTAKGVELIEFSDFQCPSCRRAAATIDEVLETYGDRITYRRIDYPLISMHPWAFPAALYGRAIHRQAPEAFWQFKKAVFESQDKLNAFTLEDFARGFVESNDLDLERFAKDIESPELREEILAAVAVGIMGEIRGTPTYWINGQPVALGLNGATLMRALDLALEDTGSNE